MQPEKNVLTLPIAIIVAGIIIAGAIFISNGNKNAAVTTGTGTAAAAANQGLDQLKPISQDEHILGNPNADIKIVTYSDTECPYCKDFHNTMEKIMSGDYGTKGQVAWVYRQFPLQQLHPKAPKEALATECAGNLGGNAKFWQYIDLVVGKKIGAIALQSGTPSNGGIDPEDLPKLAGQIGLDQTAFSKCLSDGTLNSKVLSDEADGAKIGVNGTPFSVILTKDGQKIPVNGAQPYESIKQTLDTILASQK